MKRFPGKMKLPLEEILKEIKKKLEVLYILTVNRITLKPQKGRKELVAHVIH